MSPAQRPPSERVRVTASRRSAPRHTARPVADELSDQTVLGEIYVRGLMRAQLRLALSLLLLAVLLLGGVPVLFAMLPQTRTLTLGPLPLPWVTLGLVVYPAIVISARYYVRASERLEAAFVDVVGRG
ncbi:hypothetical protein [Nostocoides australiense]